GGHFTHGISQGFFLPGNALCRDDHFLEGLGILFHLDIYGVAGPNGPADRSLSNISKNNDLTLTGQNGIISVKISLGTGSGPFNYNIDPGEWKPIGIRDISRDRLVLCKCEMHN